MAKRAYPLADLYRLLEPGPVVLVTTARNGRANIICGGRRGAAFTIESLVTAIAFERFQSGSRFRKADRLREQNMLVVR